MNERNDIEAQQEISVSYDLCYQVKLIFYYFNIFNNLYQYSFLHGRYLGYVTER